MRFADSYRRFVRGHAGAVGAVELLLPWATWLLPDRFASSELPAEIVNSACGVLSVAHDGVLEPDSAGAASIALAFVQQVRARARDRGPGRGATRQVGQSA